MKNRVELNQDAINLRKQLGLNNFDTIDLLDVVLEKLPDITIIFCPISEKTSGICINRNNIQIICINSTMNLGRQRFTLAHELYHLLVEKKFNLFVCNDDERYNDSEKEANSFASFLLMPSQALENFIDLNNISKWNLENIIKIEQHFQISHEAMLYRLYQDSKISYHERENFRQIGIVRAAKNRKISSKLYERPSEPKYTVLGKYIDLIEKLDSNNVISSGKRRELLLDAFRGDLVYNFDYGDDALEE